MNTSAVSSNSDNASVDTPDSDDKQGKKKKKSATSGEGTLDAQVTLEAFQSQLHCVLWDPTSLDRVLTVDNMFVKEWRIDGKHSIPATEFNVQRKINTAKWNPHHTDIVALGSGAKIIQLDMRTKKPSDMFDAHESKSNVLDVEYNPYSQHHMISGGDDCKVKCWDMRKKSEPLRILCGHCHWVCNVKYNPFNDQLVLSCGTDSLVNLWRLPTIASKLDEDILGDDDAPAASTTTAGNNAPPQDVESKKKKLKRLADEKDALVKTIDEHEESVYSVSWSAKSPWVFASASYDGRVLVHQVPEKEKLRILNVAY